VSARTLDAVTDVVIRQAGPADLAALAGLRREQAAEQQAEHGDPGFERGAAAASERESARRITWLGAVLGHAHQHDFARVVLNPSEGSVPFHRRAGFGPADALLLWTP
jgi:hypothetical protein